MLYLEHTEKIFEKIFTFCKAVVCVIPECTWFTSYPQFTSVFVVIFSTDSFDAQDLNVLLQVFFLLLRTSK